MTTQSAGICTPAAQEFLLELSKRDSGCAGPCQVCGRESERLVELFPGDDDAPLIEDDRLVCAQCLMLGAILTGDQAAHDVRLAEAMADELAVSVPVTPEEWLSAARRIIAAARFERPLGRVSPA